MSRATRTWDRWMQFLADYHRSVVIGASHVPREGGVVFAGTHSLASYELFIACYATRRVLGRQTYIVGDRLLFKIPGLGGALRDIGFIHATRDELVARLRQGDMVGIAPGGMRESLRSSDERFQFDWSRHLGFATVAVRAGVPVVPAVCPQADFIYHVYGNPLTRWAFENLKVPLPVFTGREGTPLPRPVRLLHLVGAPIYPDVAPDQATDADIRRFHERVTTEVRALLDAGVAMGDTPVGDDILSLSGTSANTGLGAGAS